MFLIINTVFPYLILKKLGKNPSLSCGMNEWKKPTLFSNLISASVNMLQLHFLVIINSCWKTLLPGVGRLMQRAWLPASVWSMYSCGIPGSSGAVQKMMEQAHRTPERIIWQFSIGVYSLQSEFYAKSEVKEVYLFPHMLTFSWLFIAYPVYMFGW